MWNRVEPASRGWDKARRRHEVVVSMVTPEKRALCIVNRNARSGAADRQALAQMFADAGVCATVRLVADPAEALAALSDGAAENELIVVGGGDGSVSGLLPQLLEAGKPVAILPLGTANDLANSLGIPTTLEEAVTVAATGRVRRIDIGFVDGRPFMNVASVGFGPNVARAHTGLAKRLLGVLAYPLSWIKAYRATRPFRITLTIDGQIERARCVQIAIGSGRRYGGGLILTDDASHEDGLLWLYYVKPIRLFGWLAIFPVLWTGRHRRGGRSVIRNGHRIRLETDRPMSIDADGDIVAETPAAFTIRQQALAVIVPKAEPLGAEAVASTELKA